MPSNQTASAEVAKFLAAKLSDQLAIVHDIAASDSDRDDAIRFVSSLLHELVSQQIANHTAMRTRAIDTCKTALIGLHAGTNIKLTLETVVITIN